MAEWNAISSDATGGQWILHPENAASSALREHFEYLAIRGVNALGLSPSEIPHPRRHRPSWDADLARARIDDAVANGIQPGQEHLRAWLEYLRLNVHGLIISNGAGCFQGETYEALFIRIGDVCEISAQECIKIALRDLASQSVYTEIREDREALKPSEEGKADHKPSDPALAAPPDKGNHALIAGKRSVAFGTAQRYLGIKERQRQKLMKLGVLTTEGEGLNRRITTSSLLAYLPSGENPH